MITPELEKLIFQGKAFYKTYVAAGTKCTLNIENDRFIIITDITYMGYGISMNDDTAANTQVSIYGEKGFNHFIFRNKLVGHTLVWNGATAEAVITRQLAPACKIDTYIVHTTQVGFSFINESTGTVLSGVTPYSNPGYEPPLDWGIEGMAGAVSVEQEFTPSAGFTNLLTNNPARLAGVGGPGTQQLQFPALLANKPIVSGIAYFPILNVSYIEVLGSPGNIGF